MLSIYAFFLKKIFLLISLGLFLVSNSINAQGKKSKKDEDKQTIVATTLQKNPTNYSDFVNKNTISDKGLFTIHENKDT